MNEASENEPEKNQPVGITTVDNKQYEIQEQQQTLIKSY